MAQKITTTKTIKKSVADPSDSYHSLTPLWRKSRAILQGEANVKAHDTTLATDYSNLLLPFSPSMTQAQYNFYKAEAELSGLTAQYCKVLISSLLRKKSQLTIPEELPEEALDWIETNFTLDGRSLFNFLDAALWEELQTSRCWVSVDYPKITEQQQEALTPEERDMIAPYPVIIKAENVINYQVDVHPITRQRTLTRLVLRYLTEEFDEENPWHPNYVDTVCDHYLDESGNLVMDYYRQKDTYAELKVLNGEVTQDYKDIRTETQFEKYDTITPQMFGERLKRIPAWPLNGHIDPIEPVLMPLIDREVSLYNKVSRRNHLLYGAATYTPIVSSDMTDEEFEELVSAGLGTWLRVRKDESVSVLETPTSALNDMDTAITKTVEEMAKMGIRMLSPETAQSGIALEIRNASQTAQLGTLNAKVSHIMREVISFMLNWKYNTQYTGNDVEFTLSADFAPVVGGEGAMRLVTEWYQSGLIPRDTFVSVAKYNDFIPSDYDDEAAIQAIQTDPLTQDTPDDQMELEE